MKILVAVLLLAQVASAGKTSPHHFGVLSCNPYIALMGDNSTKGCMPLEKDDYIITEQ